jgi:hypothetical protein
MWLEGARMSGEVSWVWFAAGGGLGALLLAQAVVVLGVLQRTTALLEAVEARLGASGAAPLEGPVPGTPLPDLALEDAAGVPVPAADWRGAPGTPLVLLLLGPGCPHCRRLLARLRAAPGAPTTAARVVAITDVEAAADLASTPPPAWVTVCYQREEAAAQALGAAYVPVGVAVDGNGRIVAVGVPQTIDDLARLGRLAAEPAPAAGAPTGAG